jgi:hypothetical protein
MHITDTGVMDILAMIAGIFSAAMLPLLLFALLRKGRNERIQPKVRLYLVQGIFMLICVGSYFFINKMFGTVLFIITGLAAFFIAAKMQKK